MTRPCSMIDLRHGSPTVNAPCPLPAEFVAFFGGEGNDGAAFLVCGACAPRSDVARLAPVPSDLAEPRSAPKRTELRSDEFRCERCLSVRRLRRCPAGGGRCVDRADLGGAR